MSGSMNNSSQSSPPPSSLPSIEPILRQHQLLASLRSANFSTPSRPKPTTPLDASLKNNLKWIKKLRSLSSPNIAADLVTEMLKLKLDKYLGEVSSALMDAISTTTKAHPVDSDSILILASALHQRFGPNFSSPFITNLLHNVSSALKPADQPRDEKDRLLRLKLLIRVVVESYLVGLFSVPKLNGSLNHLDNEIAAFMTPVSAALNSDAHEHANDLFFNFFRDLITPKENVALVAFLVSQYRDILFPPAHLDSPVNLVNPVFQQKLRQIILKYYARLLQVYESAVSNLNQVSDKHSEWYYDRGTEAPADLQDRMVKQTQFVQDLQANLNSLSGSLGLDPPSINIDPILNKQSTTSIVVHKQGQDAGGYGLLWEDDLEQALYTDIPSLELLLPPGLLNAAKNLGQALVNALKMNVSTDDSSSADVAVVLDEDNNLDLSTMLSGLSNDDEIPDSAEIAKQLHDLFNQLPHLGSAEEADMWAIQFCHFNTLRTQKRLVQALLKVQGHFDVLPYFGRILAVLKPLGFGNAVCLAVESTVRRLARSKVTRDYLSSRLIWSTYLAILLKFGLLKDAAVFYCMKLMFENPHPGNIEMLCILLESCGRFLAVHPVTAERMADFVAKLTNLKRRMTDTRLRILISNATVSCQPDALVSGPLVRKERSVMELYLIHLFSMLSSANIDHVSSEVVHLDWTDERAVPLIASFFIKLKVCRAPQLPFMAEVLSIVSRSYPELLVYVVDNLLERIKDCLEVSDYQSHQQQLTRIAFFGNLLVYDCIDPIHVFSLMQLLIALPLEAGTADFFRIRMVCTLLGICGKYLPKESLSSFLVVFQLFISKFHELPIDTQFSIDEMLTSLGVSCQQGNFNEVLTFAMRMMHLDRLETVEPVQEDEEQAMSTKNEPVAEPEESIDVEAELEKELEMLMAPPSLQAHADGSKKPFGNSPSLPQCFIDSETVYQKSVSNVYVPGMRSQHPKQQISIVTRRGAKMVVKALPIPEGSTFAQHAAQIQRKEDLEWQQMKKQILSSQKQSYAVPKS